jgi:prolyl-tRNA editing enzyme YbaK/EbsC (Cys-tRNA(Pro) deacylase)/GNAT superfamily N-acetyltransferase
MDRSIHQVGDAAQWRDMMTTLAAGFGAPTAEADAGVPLDSIEDALPSLETAQDRDIALFVGYYERQPAATAMFFRVDEAAVITGVATIPQFRGRGFGRALTWAAIREGARRGCTRAALNALGASYPLYRGMAFQHVCTTEPILHLETSHRQRKHFMSTPVLDALRDLLQRENVSYRLLHHEPTYTSEESARARGEEVRVGGKALVVKAGNEFRLLVLSAALSADWTAVKKHFGVKKTRMADRDELLSLTGLVPGSVPPFGRPILPLDLYVDPSVFENPIIAFNAGSLTDSIILAVEDYRKVTQPSIFPFAAR